MRASFYLVVNDNATVRAVKNRPDLKFNEVAIAVKLELPNALFTKPQLSAVIQVPDTAVTAPHVDATVSESIRDAIQTATGYEVRIVIEPPA